MKNFDDILKEGKDKVSDATAAQEPKNKWRDGINTLMSALNDLNDMYAGKSHYIEVGPAKCVKCSKPSYVIVIQDINNSNRTVRYHSGGWRYVDKSTYYCDVFK